MCAPVTCGVIDARLAGPLYSVSSAVTRAPIVRPRTKLAVVAERDREPGVIGPGQSAVEDDALDAGT